MASDTKQTSFPQASSAIATTALTQLLARTHAASIERALCGARPEIIVQHFSVVDRVTTLTVFSQQLVLFHRDGGQQTFGVRN